MKEIRDTQYVRRETYDVEEATSRPSVFVNDVPETTRAIANTVNTDLTDNIVRLEKPTISGTTGMVWDAEGVFQPSTLKRDFKTLSVLPPPEEFENNDVDAQIIAFRWERNYFHWTFQSLAGVLDMQEAGIEIDNLVLTTPLNSWRRRTLEFAGVDPDCCIVLPPEQSTRFKSGLYSSFVSGREVCRPTPRLIALYDKFSRSLRTPVSDTGCDKIYVSRVAATRRPIENEEAVCHLVRQYGFEVVQTEELSVIEQIELFSSARHVVAPHGAGLVNLLYSQRCESVTEILQAVDFHDCMFRICQAKGIPHYSLQADCAKQDLEWRTVSKVDLNTLEKHLDALSRQDTVSIRRAS